MNNGIQPLGDEHPGKMVLAKTRDHFGFAEACLSYRSRWRREILVISQLKIARARRDVAESRVSRHPHTSHRSHPRTSRADCSNSHFSAS